MERQAVGIDVGAETVKVVVLEGTAEDTRVVATREAPHAKEPQATVLRLLRELGLGRHVEVAATGRLRRLLSVEHVPTKAALRHGVRVVHPDLSALTILSIGAHGFSVLEIQSNGQDWYQQNSRCSQGTGNFLGQLVARFGLSIEEASSLCDLEEHPAALSGRCPVILKTDMTHLANKGEDRSRILAGLYDAVCENVLTLVRSKLAPSDVVLVGGVARSARIRRTIARWLEQRGMQLAERHEEDGFVEAIGAAIHVLEHGGTLVELGHLERLLVSESEGVLESVPALASALGRVHRMPKQDIHWNADGVRQVLLGMDIGSTGSKAVAVDCVSGSVLWERYLNTEGAPVHAAQRLVQHWVEDVGERGAVAAFGVTGSGREVVGSLLRTCYGSERVFVLNEIAAHARGAASIDPAVDTIFEIGGQDAKYIRLEEGRVVDAAMNEACSAGTGSFIAEQGGKFEGIGADPRRLAEIAIGADHGVSLGQHCSVFMAEVIDEAITQGAPRDAIIAGLYDSVIQNYLNRVKGSRTVGQRIFCQGMPFSSDALAAAVARQTGRDVVVPPNPGTIGALGIALLAGDEIGRAESVEPLAPQRFLAARVASKETIICRSTKGCGEPGNRCRIDRLTTVVDGSEQKFLWGGNCSLYDRGGGRRKLPDRAPDAFREREALLEEHLASASTGEGRPVVAYSDEFALKQLAVLFTVFFDKLGLRCEVLRAPGSKVLRGGVEGARVPFCAPVQMIHGVYFELAGRRPDWLFMPLLESMPRVGEEEHSTLCPMVLAMPDLVGGLIQSESTQVLRPVISFDDNGYRGKALRRSLRELAATLGAEAAFEAAWLSAVQAQERFDEECRRIGERTLGWCREQDVVPVAVLGRPYTIYNDVLNSNVPSILRSLGAMPIPVDCLPVPAGMTTYHDQYWAHTQRNLRAAEWVRQEPGLYSVFCSNYACGPDSFTLHFFSYLMQGKPFAVVETDGHSGDAGTKTRMEAFLYCVDTDVRSGASAQAPIADLSRLEKTGTSWIDAKARGARVLLPRMGPVAEVAGAALRAEGYRAEALPLSTRDDVRAGRRYTSGKECVPMMLTLGTLLNAMERIPEDEPVAFFMPTANGPCRFGVYNTLHKIALERAGYGDRVRLVIPDDSDYFSGMSKAFAIKLWVGFAVHDLLEMMLLDTRPVERVAGSANAAHRRYLQELLVAMERSGKGSAWEILRELSGGLWGTRDILRRAAQELSALRTPGREVPAVSVVGEIYVRLDPFANDHLVEHLERRGLKVKFAPFIEWLEYSNWLASDRVKAGGTLTTDDPLTLGVTGVVQYVTMERLYPMCAEAFGWGPRLTVEETLKTSRPYIDPALTGEAALTVGGPLTEFAHGLVDGVVIVGPHECMPCKISEAQYGMAAESVGLPYLNVAVTGEPIEQELIDRFAYDIHERSRRRRTGAGPSLLPHLSADACAPQSCGRTCCEAGRAQALAGE